MIDRRGFLRGLGGFIASAPAIVRVSSLMALPRVRLEPSTDPRWLDLGAVDVDTGLSLVRVPAAPLVGQYVFDERSGGYSFNAADARRSLACTFVAPHIELDLPSGPLRVVGPIRSVRLPYIPGLD